MPVFTFVEPSRICVMPDGILYPAKEFQGNPGVGLQICIVWIKLQCSFIVIKSFGRFALPRQRISQPLV